MAVYYPFYNDLETIAQNMTNGNFSLWFNKLVPLNNINVKASDDHGDENQKQTLYQKKYTQFRLNSESITAKHNFQEAYCRQINKQYRTFAVSGKTTSRYLSGLGESHPSELGMTLDHNLGIPYIPASSIKGAIRNSYIMELLKRVDIKDQWLEKDKKGVEYVDEEELVKDEETGISTLFGSQESSGNIIFLDAYPVLKPIIEIDVMTPHYPKYYSDDNQAPADNQDPNPLKFLAVKEGTQFIFRILLAQSKSQKVQERYQHLKKAIEITFQKEGLGAKTALGYGRFETHIEELKSKEDLFQEKIDQMKENLEAKRVNFDEWQNDPELKNNREIAQFILDNNLIKKQKKKKVNGVNTKVNTKHYTIILEIIDSSE